MWFSHTLYLSVLILSYFIITASCVLLYISVSYAYFCHKYDLTHNHITIYYTLESLHVSIIIITFRLHYKHCIVKLLVLLITTIISIISTANITILEMHVAQYSTTTTKQ